MTTDAARRPPAVDRILAGLARLAERPDLGADEAAAIAEASRWISDGAPAVPTSDFHVLVNTIDGIVWEADPATFIFSFVSDRAETILGYPPSQWVGDPSFWIDHVHPDDRTWAVEFCVSATREGRSHQFEYRMLAADGRVVWLRDHVTVLVEAGRPVRLRGIMVDVTDRKLAEWELKTLNETLEQRVAERSAAAEQRARELARSNAELELFAYAASHDLQEPLRAIASFSDLLARRYRGRLDADANDFIAFMLAGVDRMQALIRDLLGYASLGAAPEMVEVPLDAALDEALTDLGDLLTQTGAVVTRDALPTVRADAVQIARLFQNLLSNALKFRGAAPPRIHVSASRGEAEWTIGVGDNGIGIDSAFHERIFQALQRLHGAAEIPGTGMGLAICRKIVERHQGRIWVESQPGEGTTFLFTLPQ